MPASHKQEELDGERSQDEGNSDSTDSDWEWKGNELEVTWAELRKAKKQRRQKAAETNDFKDSPIPTPSNPDVQYRPRMLRSWSENDLSFYRELLFRSFGSEPDYSSNEIQPQTQAESNDPFHMSGMGAGLSNRPSVKETNSQSLERPAQPPPKSRRSDTRHGKGATARSGKSSSAAGNHRHQEKDKDRARKERPREDRTSEKKRSHK